MIIFMQQGIKGFEVSGKSLKFQPMRAQDWMQLTNHRERNAAKRAYLPGIQNSQRG